MREGLRQWANRERTAMELRKIAEPALVEEAPARAVPSVVATGAVHDGGGPAPDPPGSLAPLRIRALGPLEVWREGRLVATAEWGFAKPREMLVYLLGRAEGCTKEQIGLALWPDASPAQLRNSFHFTLHHLRRALGRPEWVVFQGGRYHFDRSLPHEYDVDAFEAVLTRAERLLRVDAAPAEAIPLFEESVRLYRGDFLEGAAFGDWSLERQDELRHRHLEALLALADLHLAAENHAEATRAYRGALARDNLLERAHRGLMRSWARQGERVRALRHFPVLVKLLRDEFDAAPDAETTLLHERIRRGAPV